MSILNEKRRVSLKENVIEANCDKYGSLILPYLHSLYELQAPKQNKFKRAVVDSIYSNIFLKIVEDK